MKAKKELNYKLYNVCIPLEMAAEMAECKKSGLNFQPFIRKAVAKIIEQYKKGEIYNI